MMIKNKTFINFIMVTLMVSFLTITVGKVTPVYALADPVPITAVYDTTIIQLADYVDSLPQPSIDVFYLLTGVLAAAQLGGQEFKLEDPYATSSDVIDWFKSLGIRLYNTLIGLAPNQDPILGFDVRPYVKPLVAAMMGNAVLARNYNGINDFMESDDDALIPFKADIQKSINVIWQIQGGPFHWQFEDSPWESNFTWKTTNLGSYQTAYDNYLSQMEEPLVRSNSDSTAYNAIVSFSTLPYTNLFLNSDTGRFFVCNNAGQPLPNATYNGSYYNCGSLLHLYYRRDLNSLYYRDESTYVRFSGQLNLSNYDTYLDAVHYILNYDEYVCMSDLVEHVYVGTNWVNKQEIFNLTDLNIADDGNEYYETPTDDNLLIDIKNLITDLVDDTNIWTHIINNVYDPDGVQVVNPPTIKVSVDLSSITELLAPPIPVDLNDIAELTDNSYLERVKEHARNAGDIFANYVAFWHNCDSDLVYTMFGAAILVLVGAFIGKWGHS